MEQIAILFEEEKSTIINLIKDIFDEEDVDDEIDISDFAITDLDGKSYYETLYNLEVVTLVGFRVSSKRGVSFRRWGCGVLHDYLLTGYAENRRSLELHGKTIELQSRIISPAKNTEGKELLEVIDSYSEALNILDDYDHQCLEKPKGNKGYVRLEYE